MATTKVENVNDGVGEEDKLTPEAKQVKKATDEAVANGYRGTEVDPTPNENYTVAGVVAGKPTPETDPEQAAKVGSLRFR